LQLKIFVYGTLKRGQSNHDRLCRGVLEVKAATALGRLYELPYGFPGLQVPESAIHAIGTTDYLADVEKQQNAVCSPVASAAEWDVIQGELMTFDDPSIRLPALDRLEGYMPGERSLYERVLITVEINGEFVVAWAYQIKHSIGDYLPDGLWTA